MGAEWLVILAIVVLVFGAAKLPDLARGSGQALRIFKAETKGLKNDDDEDTGAKAVTLTESGPVTQTPAAPTAPTASAPTPAPSATPAPSPTPTTDPVVTEEIRADKTNG